MKVRIIFFDIDGTLVSFKTHAVHSSAKYAINRLKTEGIKVIISTGRSFCDIDNLDDLEFDGYITSNGACCVDAAGHIIDRHLITKQNLDSLALYINKKPLPCEFMTDGGNFINFADRNVLAVSRLINLRIPPARPVHEIIEYGVFQMSPFVDSVREVELMNSVLTDCISSRWHPAFVDINTKGCSKATGMDVFLSYFGIDRQYTMAFGDGANDIPILQHAATGVAMGNASDEVKHAAGYVTGSVDDNGIVNALRHFGII